MGKHCRCHAPNAPTGNRNCISLSPRLFLGELCATATLFGLLCVALLFLFLLRCLLLCTRRVWIIPHANAVKMSRYDMRIPTAGDVQLSISLCLALCSSVVASVANCAKPCLIPFASVASVCCLWSQFITSVAIARWLTFIRATRLALEHSLCCFSASVLCDFYHFCCIYRQFHFWLLPNPANCLSIALFYPNPRRFYRL